jgi:hypothetical protein
MSKLTDMPTLVQRLVVDGIFNFAKISYDIYFSTILMHLGTTVPYPLAVHSAVGPIAPSVDGIY